MPSVMNFICTTYHALCAEWDDMPERKDKAIGDRIKEMSFCFWVFRISVGTL